MEKWYFTWKWYWKGCIITNKKWNKNYCQILDWKNFVQIFIMHQTSFWMFEWHEILRMNKRLCNSTLLRIWLKVYISLKGNKLASFANSEASLQIHDLVIFFFKKVSQKAYIYLWCTRGTRIPTKLKKIVHQNF